MAIDKNNDMFIISNKVRSLIRKELKIGPGEVRDKKMNRPISLGKEGFSRRESVERLISLLRVFHRKMNHVVNIIPGVSYGRTTLVKDL